MANKREYSRQVAHRWDTPGDIATATASTVVTNDWLVTDLIIGEVGINIADERAWFRSDIGIVEFVTSSTYSESGIWNSDGVNINLGASYSGFNVLPTTDDTSDLGSQTFRWKDLYLGSVLDVADHLTFSVASTPIMSYDGSGLKMESDSIFTTTNGSGQLDLDFTGIANIVNLSNDGGDASDSYIKLESDLVTIKSEDIILLEGITRLTSPGITTPTGILGIDASNNIVSTDLPPVFIVSDTRANIITLRDTSSLVPGAIYFLSDEDMWFVALEDDLLSTRGVRKQSIVDNTGYVVSGIVKGVWNSGLSVSVSDVVVWGAVTWVNTSGSIGTAVDDYTLSGADWGSVLGYNSNKLFVIDYLIDTNFVIKQIDDRGNELVAGTLEPTISDWGDVRITDNNTEYILNNSKSSIRSNSNKGYISGNYNAGLITHNINLGNINDNTNTDIVDNSNTGSITDNSNTGILANSNVGGIDNNSTTGIIWYNYCSGSISNNSNDGGIQSNHNTSQISSNSNTGDILSNSNMGEISSNSNNGDISSNGCGGDITFNTSSIGTLSIINNINNGDITYNRGVASITINVNINNGYIGAIGGPLVNRATSISDTIVNK